MSFPLNSPFSLRTYYGMSFVRILRGVHRNLGPGLRRTHKDEIIIYTRRYTFCYTTTIPPGTYGMYMSTFLRRNKGIVEQCPSRPEETNKQRRRMRESNDEQNGLQA